VLVRTKLIVNVTELLRSPGAVERMAFDEPVEDLQTELAWVDPTEPLRFDLSFEVVEDGVLVRGPISGEVTVRCRRCLEEMAVAFDFQAAEVYRPPRDVWEEGYQVTDDTIDLAPLVRDNVLLNLPMYPLCREDCAGLCPVCGANRNDGDCGCVLEQADARWEALRGLLPDA
jgi:uncharacterized protein